VAGGTSRSGSSSGGGDKPAAGGGGGEQSSPTAPAATLAVVPAANAAAVATNADGQKTTTTSAFTTARATRTVFPAVSPLNGMTVGVGMPIRVYFENPVTDRKAALARMKVTTSVPTVGAWRWFSATEVHWRPKTYWKSGTKVALDT